MAEAFMQCWLIAGSGLLADSKDKPPGDALPGESK